MREFDPTRLREDVDDARVARIRATMPEMPSERRRRFVSDYGLPEYDAGVLTATTYLAAGVLREHVCMFICPYGRLQSALIDDHSVVIGYDERRGEPLTLEGKVRETQALYRVGLEISRLQQLDRVLQSVVDRTREMLRGDAAAVMERYLAAVASATALTRSSMAAVHQE